MRWDKQSVMKSVNFEQNLPVYDSCHNKLNRDREHRITDKVGIIV